MVKEITERQLTRMQLNAPLDKIFGPSMVEQDIKQLLELVDNLFNQVDRLKSELETVGHACRAHDINSIAEYAFKAREIA